VGKSLVSKTEEKSLITMHVAEVMIPVWRTSLVLMEMLIPGGRTDAV
jgi:hypothetical protein